MGGAEKSVLEIIARALGVPLELVHRVIYAYQSLELANSDMAQIGMLSPHKHWGDIIENPEVRIAIDKHMDAGARRYAVRWSIENHKEIDVAVNALISDAGKICNGCPIRLECLAESLHTPQDCFTGRLRTVPVMPIRMRDGNVTVDANQPFGQYTIPVSAVRIKRY